MRSTIYLAAALALCACSTPVIAKTAKTKAIPINETTWTYVYHGKKTQTSIDADGNYIENTVRGQHLDHGTAAVSGRKICFTSKMGQGTNCWTMKALRIGQSMLSVSDKGEKLRVTRVKYTPLKMPG